MLHLRRRIRDPRHVLRRSGLYLLFHDRAGSHHIAGQGAKSREAVSDLDYDTDYLLLCEFVSVDTCGGCGACADVDCGCFCASRGADLLLAD